jgi:4-amino-4-deoxy-L-arabinose transferase-like glycosyltransferase
VWAACTLFLAFDIGVHPIVLWDESRVVSNALEMSRTGLSLVTTYGFEPDLWNTKPPLAIWLIVGCIDLFGPSEWAVRLPSLIAAVLTVGLVIGFTWRLTRSRFAAAIAAVLLTFSPGYFGWHAARSADYDAVLCLFTTAYLLLLFEIVHRARAPAGRTLAMGLLVAAACLTKGVAGLIPGVGVAAYLLARGRWRRLLRTPWYFLAGAMVVVVVGGYYVLRELAGPGYIAAVRASEWGGRYLNGKHGHIEPWWYYPMALGMLFALAPALLLLPWARGPRGKASVFLTYGSFVCGAALLVLSLSQTKIYWYAIPLYPVLAIMMGIVFDRRLNLTRLGQAQGVRLTPAVAAVGVAFLVVYGVASKSVMLPRAEISQGRYGLVFAQLKRAGVRQVETVDGGVANDDDLVLYRPQLHFYSLVWQRRGLDIRLANPNHVPLRPGVAVVSCDPRYVDWVRTVGREMTSVPGCAASAS